ncbi:MAG: hypothetical protein NWR03_14760 [Akkermansiaceae bacterium]|nr:hypothetical protein [Akkermansiaceae bacterium]
MEAENAYAAIEVVQGGFQWRDTTFIAMTGEKYTRSTPEGKTLILDEEYAPVIFEVMARSDVKSFDAFKTKVKACPLIGICFFKGFYRGAGPAGFEGVQNPVPLPPPVVDPDLERLNWPERVAEVSRYGVLCAEYWLSQRGTLWEWLRLNLWAAIVLTVAAILLIPPVTAVLKGAAEPPPPPGLRREGSRGDEKGNS